MTKLLIHQISQEISQVEIENKELKRILALTMTKCVQLNLCLINNLKLEDLINIMGSKYMEMLINLIEDQVNFGNNVSGLFFDWRGEIVKGNNLEIISNINDLTNILNEHYNQILKQSCSSSEAKCMAAK